MFKYVHAYRVLACLKLFSEACLKCISKCKMLQNNPVKHSCLLIIDILSKAVWSAASQSSAELKNPLQTPLLHFKVTVKLSRPSIPHSKFYFALVQGILILSTSSKIHILNDILQFSSFSNLKIPKCFSDGGEVSLGAVLRAQLFSFHIQRKWAAKTDGLLKVARRCWQ